MKIKQKNKTITAHQIVKKFKIPYHTVNYYTAMGLLPVLSKVGNQRLYDEKEITRRLEEITKLANEGYPLSLIRKKLVGI